MLKSPVPNTKANILRLLSAIDKRQRRKSVRNAKPGETPAPTYIDLNMCLLLFVDTQFFNKVWKEYIKPNKVKKENKK